MKVWRKFEDVAHLVDGSGDKVVCGAKVDVDKGRHFVPNPLALRTCLRCVQVSAKV